MYELGSVVKVFCGYYYHYGVITGCDYVGNPLVVSSSKSHGKVIEEPIHTFSAGKSVKTVNMNGPYDGQDAALRARRMIGKPYDLFRSNCEHFVRAVKGLTPISPQLLAVPLIAGILIVAITKNR